MQIGVIGVGRIGKVHIRNIALFVPELTIKTVADPLMNDEMQKFAKKYGVANCTRDAEEIWEDDDIQAILICSSTDTHSHYILQAAKANKHIFCEKPIDYNIQKARQAIQATQKAGVKLQTGFCRRFDHNHQAIYDMVRAGEVGDIHLIRISSRDPEPPPISYIEVSGGIFYDMMIHDFDMARFLAGSEAVAIYASGAVLVDKAIEQTGDIDTAAVTIEFANSAICMIDNSRKAVYGYDQRVEVFGSKGMARNANDTPNTASLSTAQGEMYGTALQIMWERYSNAFIQEIKAFARSIIQDQEPPVTGMDGLYPVLMAAAAKKSLAEGRRVLISEVE